MRQVINTRTKHKYKAVVFTGRTARIVTNRYRSELAKIEGAIIGPDLTAVRGVKMEFWKRGEGNIIVPMNHPERFMRRAVAKLSVGKNEVYRRPSYDMPGYKFIFGVLMGIAAGVMAIPMIVYLVGG